MTRRLAWVAITLLVAYLVFVGGGSSGIYLPAIRLASVVLAGLVLAIWAVATLRDPSLRPRSNLTPAIAACLGSLAISTVFSRFPGISLEFLGYAIVLASLYLLLVRLLADDFFRRRLIAAANVLFLVVVAVDLGLVFIHWVQWWEALGRITVPPLRPGYEGLTFGSPSGLLMAVALLGVPIVASAEWTTRRGVLIVGAVLLTVATVALLSGSRAGWLALALAGAFGAAIILIHPMSRASLRQLIAGRIGTGSGRVGLAIALISILGLTIALTPAIARRTTEGGEGNRLTYINVALRLFAESPVVGTGPGTWVIQRPAETLPGEFDDYIPHAHNIVAQTLGELGLVGVGAGVILVIVLARLLARAARSEIGSQRRWAWTTVIALAYFTAHHLFDFYVNFPSILFLLAFPVAYLDATQGPLPQSGRLDRFSPPRRVMDLISVGAVAIAIGGLALQELPALKSWRAVEGANAGDWIGADDLAREAAGSDPRISPYLFGAGLTAAHNGDHAAAIGYFRTVAERDDLSEAWLNLAAEELEAGNRANVEPAIRAALRTGSQRPSIAIPAGELALRAGHPSLGLDTLAKAVTGVPSFLGDPWWNTNPTVAGLRADVAEEATRMAPTRAWEFALMSGNAAEARQLAPSAAADPVLAIFIDAWEGDQIAQGELTSHCVAYPFDTRALGWCARIASRLNNQEEVDRLRYLAGTTSPGSAAFGAELRVLDASKFGSIDPNLAQFWASFTYRRSVPWDMLVPSLVHLTLR